MTIVKRFRRGKKFQESYFDIGNTNEKIAGLLIEAESFKRNGNLDEAKSRIKLAESFRSGLKSKYDAKIFDLSYTLPQCSGLYTAISKNGILKNP